MSDTTTNQDAFKRLWFYVQNSLGYTGEYTFTLFMLRDDGDGVIYISGWNTGVLGSQPTWTTIDTYYDGETHYPDGVYPIVVSGDFTPFTTLIKYSTKDDSIIVNFERFSIDLGSKPSLFTSLNPIPISVRPSNELNFQILGVKDSIPCQCYLKIDTDGIVTIYSDINRDVNTSVFIGVSGIEGSSIPYKI